MIHRESLVCGIDPGLATTGYAIVRSDNDRTVIVDAGVCRGDPRKGLPDRLADLERDMAAIFGEHRPSLVGVEALYAHYKHPRTAILMGHARGVILCAAARNGIDVRSFNATKVKKYLTGNGRASKAQMQRAIQVALGLGKLPEPADLADAIAIALCCASHSVRSLCRMVGSR